MRLTIISLTLVALSIGSATAQVPHVNWENHPVRSLDISPNRQWLAVAHTADNRVQFFHISQGKPVRAGHLMVGVDPVAVQWRTNDELWVVNHISDSISVIDFSTRTVTATLQTADEPFDVVFAGSPQRAFVSASQANQVQVFDPSSLGAQPTSIDIGAEDPRALAVSPDNRFVYAAIFESGNRSTIIGGGLIENNDALRFPPNLANDNDTPSGGINPVPNDRNGGFLPPLNPELPPAPRVGLILRQDAQGRWRDDTEGDWTRFVSGTQASRSGRVPGWTLIDRDVAIIDSRTLAVRYAEGLMNIGMALAVNPSNGEVALVGTDATNEVRFEPNLNGRFLRVNFGKFAPTTQPSPVVVDLNPQLRYDTATVAQSVRDSALGDPRGIVWRQDGQRAYVSGMGSNNVIAVDRDGARIAGIAPIEVGAGPTGLALDEGNQRLYVWNHFDASLSVVDTQTHREIDRVDVFNPLPQAIVDGRVFLYGTHETSGSGHVSCASCHVDARMDRLAWDLGDPAGEMKAFNQNCQTTQPTAFDPCEDYHPMKGPMVTQTLQDIIGNEPFHWRGDRDGIEEFNPAFTGLLGDDRELTAIEMQQFKDFLATIYFPPNPFRNLDNSLPDSIDLKGHVTSGRFGAAGQPLGSGNPRNGLRLYTEDLLDGAFQCASCHTLPTGMAVNGPLMLGNIRFPVGGSVMAADEFGNNHLGIVTTDGSTNRSIKTPQLRNMYDKVGFELSLTESRAGFGFLHDGSVDSLARFLSASAFSVANDQEVADLVALMLAFTGSDFEQSNPFVGAAPPMSKDSHAGVGHQMTLNGQSSAVLEQMLAQANAGRIGVIASRAQQGWQYQPEADAFSDGLGGQLSRNELLQASATQPITLSVVPASLTGRLGTDRDGDGVSDAQELKQGSNPADASSATLRPHSGLWFNPQRNGHGVDIQLAGSNLLATWYTYDDDGSPTWYQAVGPWAEIWTADLLRYQWNGSGADAERVGSMTLNFADRNQATLSWLIGERSGTEPLQRLVFDPALTLQQRTGAWYDAAEPGWGLSVDTQGTRRAVVAYFYDAQNQPRWALGSSANDEQPIEFQAFTGFCPDCNWQEPQARDAGQVRLRLSDDRAGFATMAIQYTTNSGWQRNDRAVQPLSDVVWDPAAF